MSEPNTEKTWPLVPVPCTAADCTALEKGKAAAKGWQADLGLNPHVPVRDLQGNPPAPQGSTHFKNDIQLTTVELLQGMGGRTCGPVITNLQAVNKVAKNSRSHQSWPPR